MPRPSQAFNHLAARSARELEEVLVRGEAPSAGALSGYEYRGLNHGPLPGVLGVRKFIKGFAGEADSGLGFNRRARQNGREDAWHARHDDRDPHRFGFFTVEPVDARARDNSYLHALLLDYGKAAAGRANPVGWLRDYLVRVDPASDELLIGKAYLALGPARLPVGFFLLERDRPFEPDDELTQRLRRRA